MIESKRTPTLYLTMALMFACGLANASTVFSNTTVTGELYFGSDFSTNWFNPANVAGFLNSPPGNGTVIISNSAVEFGYSLAGFVSVDLNDSTPQLSVVFNTLPSGVIPALTIYLTDNAFQGLAISPLTDSFPGGITSSLVGDKISLTWPGTVAIFGTPCSLFTCHSATFDLVSTPESSTGSLAVTGILVLVLATMRLRVRRRA